MKRLVIYVHGKGGTADESKHFKPLFVDCDVIGFDYQSEKPWEAKDEFSCFFDVQSKGYDAIILVANSIGAYFSMHALSEKNISQAFLISPIIDMEKLISDIMAWANVTNDELQRKKEIKTAFGETLSWDYLNYAKNHPLNWNIPTQILYGEKDNLTSIVTISEFIGKTGAALTIMKGGEHWFHTPEQMRFLDDWIIKFFK